MQWVRTQEHTKTPVLTIRNDHTHKVKNIPGPLVPHTFTSKLRICRAGQATPRWVNAKISAWAAHFLVLVPVRSSVKVSTISDFSMRHTKMMVHAAKISLPKPSKGLDQSTAAVLRKITRLL
jgi:hypothetical protein